MLAIFLLIVHTWLVQSYVVTSGSMAPTLLGQHREVVCHDCGMRFAVGSQPGSEPLWAEARAICPNCGSAANPLADLPDAPGDGLLVFCGAFDWRRPRRWEPVVFRSTTDDSQLMVKRVVGLPGETIELVDGNVIVDGQLARKPLATQRATAILVNADRYRPGSAQPVEGAGASTSCWRPRDVHKSAWTVEPGEFRYRSSAEAMSTASRALDWIDFHPWQRPSASQDSAAATSAGIDDHYAYNQSRPILELRPVNELLLRCELQIAGDKGDVCFRTADRDHLYEVLIRVHDHDAILSIDEHQDVPRPMRGVLHTNPMQCEISTIDRQFIFALDGTPIFQTFDTKAPDAQHDPADRRQAAWARFSIGAAGVSVDVRHCQVFRDIYYTGRPVGFPASENIAEAWRVGSEELFVLGDNSPFSQDSRVTPNVALAHLVGRPLVVWAPRRASVWHDRQWNLLDLPRVRLTR